MSRTLTMATGPTASHDILAPPTMDESTREDFRVSAGRIEATLRQRIDSAPATIEGYIETVSMFIRVHEAIFGAPAKRPYSDKQHRLATIYTYVKHIARKKPRSERLGEPPCDASLDELLYRSIAGFSSGGTRENGWRYLLQWAKLDGLVHPEIKPESFRREVHRACERVREAGIPLEQWAEGSEEVAEW